MKNKHITKGKALIGKLFAASLAALLLVLASCSNFFEPPEASSAKKGEGLFSLSIAEGHTAKTILPPEMRMEDFKSYSLMFKSPGKELRINRKSEDLSEPVNLTEGTWSLTLTAYRDSYSEGPPEILPEKPSAKGSLTGIVISSGATVNKTVTLKPIVVSGAEGTFEWDIDYPEDAQEFSLTISRMEETGSPDHIYFFKGGAVNPVTTIDEPKSKSVPLKTGCYIVLVKLKDKDGRVFTIEEILHIYQNMKSVYVEYNFAEGGGGLPVVGVVHVINGNDSGDGSLREAVETMYAGEIIAIDDDVGTIVLDTPIIIDKNITRIEGNGVTIEVAPSWTTGPMFHIKPGVNVDIYRTHFMDGRSLELGGAIYNEGGNMRLFSCIFSGNRSKEGGALYNTNSGEISVKGCTFYGNSAIDFGGAIYNNNGIAYLQGNLFFENTASSWGIVAGSNTVSFDYNVVDVPFGPETNQTGWEAVTGDKTLTEIGITGGGSPVSIETFEPANMLYGIIPVSLADFPTTDFNGNQRTSRAPGAVDH